MDASSRNGRRLRISRTADFRAALALAREAGLEVSDDAGEPLALWGARDDGRLVGIVSLSEKDGLPVIEWIAIEGAYRGCGLGRRLLAAAEDEARRRGEPALYATARAPGFFMRMGYEVVPGGEQERVPLLAGCEGCAQLGGTCRPEAVRKRFNA